MRQREVQGQSPVLSQIEQELPPSSLPSPPIVKQMWTWGPGAGPPPPSLSVFFLLQDCAQGSRSLCKTRLRSSGAN